MTLEQLRIFVAVAEREHVTRAAASLNMVQSAVSHAVAALEETTGLALFDRIGRRVVLTEAGTVLLAEAHAVLARAEVARARLRELAGLEVGTLSIHASQTIAGYWLPSRLAAFRRRHPGIALRLLIGNTGEVAASVRSGTVDLGLVEGDIADPALESIVVARDQLVLVVSPDHAWANAETLGTIDLLDADWVLREPGSGTRSVFEGALRDSDLALDTLRVVMEMPSNEAVRAAVEAGLGVSVLSASVAASGIEAGLLCQVPFALPPRHFSALRHRQRQLARSADAFLELLRER